MLNKLTHWWDLLWQVHLLRKLHLPLLEWTIHIHILQLITEINGLLDQSDKTPFDFQGDRGSLVDSLEKGTTSCNGEGLTTIDGRG